MQKLNEMFKITEDDQNNLIQNWIKKQKDTTFLELINTLDANEELLMMYTSNLEEAACELKNCKNCNQLAECKNNLKGYKYTPQVNHQRISFDYIACPFQKQDLMNNQYKENILLFEVPKSIQNASFKNISLDDKKRADVIKYFKEFIENYQNEEKPKGIYLHGSFGTGKTYLVAALFNELAKKGTRSALVYVPEFLRVLKSSFNTDYEEKYDYIKKVPLLLLDDIGAENLSPWARDEIIGTLLQYRMEEKLPTFFTSNLDLKQLEEHFSSTNSGIDKLKARRIMERINFLTKEYTLTSKNRRE
ncbi:MAG: primosomal protein DnaI [Firmicutes bacterium]|nr:primosomal protein DnaI [Bacillota bacterium]